MRYTWAEFGFAVFACPRCEARVYPQPVEVTVMGDKQPTYMPGPASCPTPGCGTTCRTCGRKPGDVHGPHCGDRMVLKVERPHIVDESDCR